jgi:myo-inositol-1(or 4)-monophosphatase
MGVDLTEILEIARRAAAKAAVVHARLRRPDLGVATKGFAADLVTDVDRESERELVAEIRRARPHDAILGEEGTALEGSTGIRWVLDPLDGTTNYVYGYPAHAVAVGVELDGARVAGVVHDTYHGCVYTGVVGVGARRDAVQIAVREESSPSRALLGTGFVPDVEARRRQGELLLRVLPYVRDVRRSGCPALDLCAVAAGVLDGYFESGLGRWDIAAGAAIVEAAGGTVVELRCGELPEPLLVAANARLVEQIVRLLRAEVV